MSFWLRLASEEALAAAAAGEAVGPDCDLGLGSMDTSCRVSAAEGGQQGTRQGMSHLGVFTLV